jgi:hypothetical protein
VLIQLIRRDWLSEPFSHVNFFPFDWRLDEVEMTAFAVAAVGFLLWQIQLGLESK